MRERVNKVCSEEPASVLHQARNHGTWSNAIEELAAGSESANALSVMGARYEISALRFIKVCLCVTAARIK